MVQMFPCGKTINQKSIPQDSTRQKLLIQWLETSLIFDPPLTWKMIHKPIPGMAFRGALRHVTGLNIDKEQIRQVQGSVVPVAHAAPRISKHFHNFVRDLEV